MTRHRTQDTASAQRARSAVIEVPDFEHRDTQLSTALLQVDKLCEEPRHAAMLRQSSNVRVDGISAELSAESLTDAMLTKFKESMVSCCGCEPVMLEVHPQRGAAGWSLIQFRGPRDAAKCIRSLLVMRDKGVETVMRARLATADDIAFTDGDAPVSSDQSASKEAGGADEVLYNSEGQDLSNLPDLSGVMRIKAERKVKVWFKPGERTVPHTTGAKIGSSEYLLSFIDTMR